MGEQGRLLWTAAAGTPLWQSEAQSVPGVTVVSHSAAVGGALHSGQGLLRSPAHALTRQGTRDPEQLASG